MGNRNAIPHIPKLNRNRLDEFTERRLLYPEAKHLRVTEYLIFRLNLITLAASFLAGAFCSAEDPSFVQGVAASQKTEISFPDVLDHDNVIRVNAEVGNHSGLFMLDTGASCHLFDPRLAPLLGKRIDESEGSIARGSKIQVIRYEPPLIRLGSQSLAKDPFCAVISLANFSSALGEQIDGVIGVTALRGRLLLLNFDDRSVRLVDREAWTPWASSTSFPVIVSRLGSPYIIGLKANGEDVGPVLVDTGSNSSLVLRTELFDKLVACHLIRDVCEIGSVDGAGLLAKREGVLQSIQLGSFNVQSVLVCEGDKQRLGIGFLSRFLVALDMGSQELVLKRGARFALPDTRNRSGMGILFENGLPIVSCVDRATAASEAGIRKGDKILKVGERSVSILSPIEIRRVLKQEAGTVVVLAIDRNGSQLVVPVTLRNYVTEVPFALPEGY